MIELADLKAWLGVTGTAHDDALTDLEARALATVERALDWYFGPPRAATEVLDGTGTGSMYLRQPPVGGAVVLETRGSITSDWSAVEAERWELDRRGLHCVPGYTWHRGRRNFRAQYDEGFVDPPGDIYQLVLEMVTAAWKRRGKSGLTSERIGDYAYTLKDVKESASWAIAASNWKRGRI